MPSLDSLSGLLARLKTAGTALALVARRGWPLRLIRYHGGLGDHLLCTAVAREWRRRGVERIWMMSDHPELFAGNADVAAVVPEEMRLLKWALRTGVPVLDPTYARRVPGEDRQERPGGPVIARMCALAGITGEVELRPYLHLTEAELGAGAVAERQIALISSGRGARYPMATKEWYPERFQAVVDGLRGEFNFVQVGGAGDPALRGVVDLRGKLSLRESAAMVARSLVFLGTVGFLMHVARAVGTRSVIVYGGREMPEETGYAGNENLYTPLGCAPCWLIDGCPYDRECMKMITVERVVAALRRQAARAGEPWAAQRVTLPEAAA